MTVQIMTIKEVADYLKVNERTVYRMASAGKIPAFKVGGAWRIKATELEAWIGAQSNQNNGR